MIILPDKNIPRAQILMPVHKKEWRTPSHAVQIDDMGNQTVTLFKITGRVNDGAIIWQGWFEDRDDADAFIYGVVTGSIRQERELWRLPVPNWSPDVGEHLTYDFATVTYITASPGSNQTYNVPSDWNSGNNKVECIGGGASGATANTSRFPAGGGGAYAYKNNVSLTRGGTATYQIGNGGSGAQATAGGDTWFNATTFASSSVGAKAGLSGAANAVGSGGASASCIGDGANSGGNGGAAGSQSGGGAGGGGAAGAAGAGGAGAIGVDSPGYTGSGGGGGNGGGAGTAGGGGSGTGGAAANNGGAGGNGGVDAAGSTGGNGTNLGSTYGSGGGGGGGDASTNGAGGAGGNYGAGGGSGGGAGAYAAGKQGIIVVTYEPIKFQGFNMPVLGM